MAKFVIEAVVFLHFLHKMHCVLMFNSVGAAILEPTVGRVRCIMGYSWIVSVLPFGSSRSPKVVSIKIFTVSRDRLVSPDRNFSIQAIAVVPVFSVFFDRPRSFLWCFHIIAPVAWTQFEKTWATRATI